MVYEITGVDLARSILTLVGHFLSVCGACTILVCYAILPQRRHVRHALIINLAVADLINAANGLTSGLYVLSRGHYIPEGPGCTFNGFIAQFSVQGIDCSILMIAIATLLFLQTKIILPKPSLLTKCTIRAGSIALGRGLYQPVSGNWCWIKAKPAYLRYVLTHMWRFLFIFLCTGIYLYVYIFLRRHFRQLQTIGLQNRASKPQHEIHHHNHPASTGTEEMGFVSSNNSQSTASMGPSRDGLVASNQDFPRHHKGLPGKSAQNSGNRVATEARIKKMLLLNSYPIMYIILWIPGIVNRIVEGTGSSSRVLAFLQTSTAFIGLVNAITYGLTENVLAKLKKRFRRR
ncbi:MAG: hypothetical protein M1816_001279 [Peltula sp. TS41687]|nr:MAG: hypothetical protein M1816_001279 [Peltula sp. TS41687]